MGCQLLVQWYQPKNLNANYTDSLATKNNVQSELWSIWKRTNIVFGYHIGT